MQKSFVLQRNDEQLKVIFNEINALSDGQVHSGNYTIHKNGLLVHDKNNKSRDDTEESVIKQIVVPYDLRKNILYLAHELPSAGFLGMNKTMKHICKYFHWPNVNKDVKKYCKSCDVCQKMIKSKVNPCAPMVKPPIIGEAFSRISCDIDGPLRLTSKGN